ncbi:MAG: ChaB family protein [Cyanobacteria bacterium P01_A01_bin.84]
MPDNTAKRTVSAVFKQEEQVSKVIQRLLDRGVPRNVFDRSPWEHRICMMRNSFQSQTRVAGFISNKEPQRTFIERYNRILDETDEDNKAEQAVWETVHQQYEEDENGIWSKVKVTS